MAVAKKMMRDPFKIEGPAVISFSGGRTSGYMLWRILQAHQWILPDDVKVIFANTGKEMPETLDFVRDCSVHWNVPVTWVEYRKGKNWAIVTHETASRNGEPFATLIRDKKYLPTPMIRLCTIGLKIMPMLACAESWGWKEWTVVVGLRADEPRRVAKLSNKTEVFERIAPLAEAGISIGDVMTFWRRQDFDLKLPVDNHGKSTHGNCDLCFLKGSRQLQSMIRQKPERAIWWMEQEKYGQQIKYKESSNGVRFRNDQPSYHEMYRLVTQHGELFQFDDEPLQDCMCTD